MLDQVNIFRESIVILVLDTSDDYEKSLVCHNMETSIQSTLQDFAHYCGDIYAATHTPAPLLNPGDLSLDPEDSASGVDSSLCHRHQKSARCSGLSIRRSQSSYSLSSVSSMTHACILKKKIEASKNLSLIK